MANTLHITSGDIAGKSLGKAKLSGEVFVWHDILHDGPTDRLPLWTSDVSLKDFNIKPYPEKRKS